MRRKTPSRRRRRIIPPPSCSLFVRMPRGPRGRHERQSALARRAGSADLPLHGGRVPAWLGERMTRLGAVISQAIVHHYGRDELLRRLAHPFWFQSFGAVMGMDWHSSGITTSVIGALKRGLTPLAGELGIHVCGGRGRHSRQTPHELVAIGERVGFDGAALAQASRLVAKVDSAAVQDGFELYLHGFIVTDDGQWVVVQQGMNGDAQAGAPLSLAVRRADELRRRAARGDRGAGAGRDRQPHRPPRRGLARRRRSSCCATLGPDGIARELARARAGARAGAERRRSRCCRIWSCRRITTCAPSDVIAAPPARQPRRGGRSRPGRFRRAAAGARRRRAHGARAGAWWPRWCTARPAASPIRRASRSPMAARTAIPSRCR